MRFEAVVAAFPCFVRMPGVGVHGGDDPIMGDLPGDLPPPATGCVRIVDPFHVLPSDQRQQRQRRSAAGGAPATFPPAALDPTVVSTSPDRPCPEVVSVLVKVASTANTSPDQGVHQLAPSGSVVPGDVGLAGLGVVDHRCQRGHRFGAEHLPVHPADRRDQLRHGVLRWPPHHPGPWNPTPAASCL